MSDQFVGEIRIFGGNFAPSGWALCNGLLMSITQNTALFSLLGTQFGGDGRTTFALPNFQGAAPLGLGQGPGLSERRMGDTGGESAVTLFATQMPSHKHPAQGTSAGGTQTSPLNAVLATPGASRGAKAYDNGGVPNVTLHPTALATTGGNAPHNNLPPFLVLNFIIALVGIFPARP